MILVGYSATPSLGGLLDPRCRNWGFYRIWRSPVTGVLCQEVQTNYLSGSKNVWLLAGHWPSSDMVIEKKGWNGTYTTHFLGDYVGTPISWNNLNTWMIQLDASSATSPGPFCASMLNCHILHVQFWKHHSLHFYLSSSSPCFPPPCGNQWTTQKAVRDTERETKVRSLQGATALGDCPGLGGVGPSQRFRSGSYSPVSMRRKSPINGGFNGEHI